MKHKILLLYTWVVRMSLYVLPDAPVIMRLRGKLYGLGMQKCGKNFQVTHNAILNTIEKFSVGDDVYIANNCVLLGGGNITIEDEVMLGPGVVLASDNHTKHNGSYRFGKAILGNIHIEKGAWVGANCVLTAFSKLPSGSVIAANSVLTKVFECPDSVYGGVPAKKIK